MKTLLSLFDYTGNWSLPFSEAGWNVILWDIKHDESDLVFTHGDIEDASADYLYEHIFDNFETIDGIMAAVPCTDFSVSGARWWAEKDANGQTEKSIKMVHYAMEIIEVCNPDFWVIENPVSRIHKLVPELGRPKMYFNPCDFGDPYTKKTALYGQFNTNLKRRPVEPTEGSKMHKKYGGKSEATKTARSETPMGFANAFFEANKNYSRHDLGVELTLF
jgi:hypothetical protein